VLVQSSLPIVEEVSLKREKRQIGTAVKEYGGYLAMILLFLLCTMREDRGSK
jgi:hypothetical protein